MARGGAGRGQGRKPKASTIVKEAVADAVFKRFGGEDKAWDALAKEAHEKDLRLFFEVLKFQSLMRHGHPVHRTELTGKNDGPVDIRMSIEEARALTRKMLAIDAASRNRK